MTHLRCSAALAAVLLFAALSPASTSPAAAETTRTLTISADVNPVVFRDGIGPRRLNDTVQLRGDLTEPAEPTESNPAANTPVAGAEVQLYRAELVDEDFELVATLTTDEQGTWHYRGPVVGNSYYVATHLENPGTEGHPETQEYVGSDTLSVRGVRDLNTRKDRVAGHLTMRGRVMPGWHRKPVHLGRRRCPSCDWVPVATRRTGERGGFTFRLQRPRSDEAAWVYRAWVRGTERWGRSTGTVLVRR